MGTSNAADHFNLLFFIYALYIAAAEQEGMMANINNGRQNGEVEFNIIERIGVIETQANGWNKEVNIVSWNGGQPKYDIREWDANHERMSKGITLLEKEAYNLAVHLAKKFKLVPGRQSAAKPDESKDQSRDEAIA